MPFSFKEYLVAMNFEIKDKTLLYGKKRPLLKKHFADYMKWGGFPEVALVKTEFEKTRLIKEYLSAMYFRDLVERYNMTNIHLLENLVDKIFSSFSTKISLTAFYKQFKDRFPFSKDLLFRYYKHFLHSMLVFEVRKFTESAYKRMRYPAKVYLIDTGLCRRVTSADTGRVLENIIALELKRRGYEMFYFEDKKECDFVIKTEKGELSPIQATLEMNEQNEEREVGGLTDACKHLGTDKGMILTYDEERELIRDGIKIKIMPVWKWLLT